ncbi:MAG: hypothetical protein JO181_03615 [Solirubrobacterales bacterium]|nr:hypothetical protein [Solirubrobacterales bacterium]
MEVVALVAVVGVVEVRVVVDDDAVDVVVFEDADDADELLLEPQPAAIDASKTAAHVIAVAREGRRKIIASPSCSSLIGGQPEHRNAVVGLEPQIVAGVCSVIG